jgi:hypothetical protein
MHVKAVNGGIGVVAGSRLMNGNCRAAAAAAVAVPATVARRQQQQQQQQQTTNLAHLLRSNMRLPYATLYNKS